MAQDKYGNTVIKIPRFNIRNAFQSGMQRLLGVQQDLKAINRRVLLPASARIVAKNEFMEGSQFTAEYVSHLKYSGLIYEAYSHYAVYRNINVIARILAAAVFEIQQQDSKNPELWLPVKGHPAESVIESVPNPYMSQSYIWLLQVINLYLYGESYWYQIENLNGDLKQLYPLPPSSVSPIPDPQKLIMGYAYRPISGSKANILRPKSIVYHRFPNPLPGCYHFGLSPITAFLMGLKTSIESQRNTFNDLLNGLNLHQIVSFSEDIDEDVFSQSLIALNDMVERGERFKAIRAGDITIENTSSPQDGTYAKAVSELSENEIDSVFGFTQDFWRGNASRASKDSAINMIINSTWDLAVMLAEDFTVQAIRPRYGNDFRLYPQEFRPKDEELELKKRADKRYTQTYNEAREADGLDKHPNPIIGMSPATSAGRIAEILVSMGSDLSGEETGIPTQPITETTQVESDNNDVQEDMDNTSDTDDTEELAELEQDEATKNAKIIFEQVDAMLDEFSRLAQNGIAAM